MACTFGNEENQVDIASRFGASLGPASEHERCENVSVIDALRAERKLAGALDRRIHAIGHQVSGEAHAASAVFEASASLSGLARARGLPLARLQCFGLEYAWNTAGTPV